MAHSRHPAGCAAHSLSRFARLSGSSSKVGCRRWIRTIIAGSKIRSPACWTTRQKYPRQELHLRPQGPQPCVLSAELRGRNWSHRQDLHPAPAHTKGAHRFLCFGGKLRHAGDAPAHPRWQRGVLLIDECRVKVVRREGSAPSRAGCRPAMLLLHHRRFFKLAAGVGIAPTSRALQTRAHLSMPSSEKICVREELHLRCLPKGPGFTDQGDTSGSRLARLFGQGRGTCTHPAGFTGPSANWLHYPLKNGRAGGTYTRDPLLPRQVRWLLRYSPKFVPGHRLHPVPLGP